MTDHIESIRDGMDIYGGFFMGTPPSDCVSQCPVMHDQIPAEIRSEANADRLDAFRMAVTQVVSRTWKDPNSVEELRAQVAADRASFLGFSALDEAGVEQAFNCAQEVSQGKCRLLDITVRKVGSAPAYSIINATLQLFKSVVPQPKTRGPSFYHGIENLSYEVDEGGTVKDKMIEEPPKLTKEEAFRVVLKHIVRMNKIDKKSRRI